MVATLVGPFLRDFGLTKEAIAIMKGTVGSATSLLGAVGGGWLAFRAGRRRTLLACGVLQSLSLLIYVAAAAGLGGIGLLWAGTVAEHLLGSMATVALFTLMMDASDPEHAGTDYTLLACAVVVAMGLASFTGAVIADAAGYATSFAVGFGLSLAGCLGLVRALDRRRGPVRLQPVWSAV
jgi:MFS family permease